MSTNFTSEYQFYILFFQRTGVYSVDVPMQQRNRQGHVNEGYRHSAAYGHPNQQGQHFDRIAQPRKY